MTRKQKPRNAGKSHGTKEKATAQTKNSWHKTKEKTRGTREHNFGATLVIEDW